MIVGYFSGHARITLLTNEGNIMGSVKAKNLKVGDIINLRFMRDGFDWQTVYSVENENDIIIVNREFRINKEFFVSIREPESACKPINPVNHTKRDVPIYFIGTCIAVLLAGLIGYAVGSHSSPPRIDVYVDETEHTVCYYTAASMQCLPQMSEDE